MTKNPDGSWTISGWLVKTLVTSLITAVGFAVASGAAAIGGFWTFSGEVKADIAVIKTQQDDMAEDIHDLKQAVDAMRSRS